MSSQENLNNLSKGKLIDMIKSLKLENSILKEMHEHMAKSNERLERLEREQFKHFQYQRRDTIEISGIPTTVNQADLEKEVVKIYNAARVAVNEKKLEVHQIQACHRIGRKGVTICKFVNRKYATEGIYCGRNLKNCTLYGGSPVYINHSFCNEFRHLNFLIRKAKGAGKLYRYKVKHGVNFIKVGEDDDDFVEISHKIDLVNLGIIDETTESQA